MNPRRLVLALGVVIMSGAALTMAQEQWFPRHVQDGTAQQLADRMAAIDGAEPATHVAVAQSVMVAARSRLESWGDAGTRAQVPQLAYLDLPAHDQLHLDAMRRTFVCITTMEVRAVRAEAAAAPPREAIALAVGSAGLTVSIAMLRHHFLLAGGDEATIEEAITGNGMEAVVERLQSDPALLARAWDDCSPLVRALLTP